jgi:hypothetical protein
MKAAASPAVMRPTATTTVETAAPATTAVETATSTTAMTATTMLCKCSGRAKQRQCSEYREDNL